MPELENKFLVINHKYLDSLPENVRFNFQKILGEVKQYLPDNKYLVCNQDEPYADTVLNIILNGEDLKDSNNEE